MRKLTLLFCLFWAYAMSAQITVRDLLKTMPDSIVPYLTENNRLDMIDFMASQMDAVVTNALGGKSQLVALTDQYASLRLNESSEVILRLFDVPTLVDSIPQVLCLIHTYGTDFRESSVTFYSGSWRQLPTADYFSAPEGTWLATLGDQEPILTLSRKSYFDSLLKEEHEEVVETSKSFKWNGCFVKKD